MGRLQVKVNFGNGNPEDNKIIDVGPPFASQEEAYEWANNTGAEAVQDVIKTEFDLGSMVFDFDFA